MMICVPKQPAQSGSRSQTGRASVTPRRTAERAREVLAREVAFIDNAEFRRPGAEDQILASPPPGPAARTAKIPAGMPGHLQRLCSPPLLSPEQEVRLFRRMNYLKYRANVLRSQIRAADADPRQLDRVDSLIRTGEEVRNQIVHANVRLVMSIAKKFADNRSSFDDLLSEGISSLIRAVEKFDYSRGFRFSTYATSVVRRDLMRMLRSNQTRRQRFATGNSEYLDAQCGPEVEEGQRVSEDDWEEVSGGLQKMLDQLDRRERLIIRGRYGLDAGGRKVTFKALGQQLGVSKERVRQLFARAMQKLQQMVQEGQLGDRDFSV